MGELNAFYYNSTLSLWYLISGGLALLGAVAAGVYFLRPVSRTRYTGLMQKLNAHVNFERPDLSGTVKVRLCSQCAVRGSFGDRYAGFGRHCGRNPDDRPGSHRRTDRL